MTADELRQLLRTSAFRPFTVYSEDKGFHIPHPEFAALSPSGRTLIIFQGSDAAYDILDVALIARAKVEEQASGDA